MCACVCVCARSMYMLTSSIFSSLFSLYLLLYRWQRYGNGRRRTRWIGSGRFVRYVNLKTIHIASCLHIISSSYHSVLSFLISLLYIGHVMSNRSSGSGFGDAFSADSGGGDTFSADSGAFSSASSE